MEQRIIQSLRNSLLDWYDAHGRDLPWRAKMPLIADPYHVWISEMMLQQTTVATVKNYYSAFLDRWPTIQDLARSTLDDVLTAWQGLGYYARARYLHRCSQLVVNTHAGIFPSQKEALETLPGIGPYVSAALAAIAFDQPFVPVDGNVVRVLTRLYGMTEALPQVKNQVIDRAHHFGHAHRPGDFAQALMDLGAVICTPSNPQCSICPWQTACIAFREERPQYYPVKKIKKAKPTRYATAFVILNPKREILLRKRQETGLLAGLYEVPTTVWSCDSEKSIKPPRFKGQVKHTFTHFHLKVDVHQGASREQLDQMDGVWIPLEKLSQYALPTLMKKIIAVGLNSSEDFSQS
jgi:A/G-specific adenine glycosylase